MDKYSTKLIQNGIALKKYLSREDDSFVVLFEYETSENKQGYWIYEHFFLQMEYYLEFLKVIYPSFGFVFLFDHSCGRDWAREGRLQASIMRKYFGGKQPNIRDTVILGQDGFIGPYDHFLETGDIQKMWWDPDLPDSQLTGPFWISDMENAEHRHNVFTGKTKSRKLNKNKLIERLHSSGVVAKGNKTGIVSKTKENYISVE